MFLCEIIKSRIKVKRWSVNICYFFINKIPLCFYTLLPKLKGLFWVVCQNWLFSPSFAYKIGFGSLRNNGISFKCKYILINVLGFCKLLCLNTAGIRRTCCCELQWSDKRLYCSWIDMVLNLHKKSLSVFVSGQTCKKSIYLKEIKKYNPPMHICSEYWIIIFRKTISIHYLHNRNKLCGKPSRITIKTKFLKILYNTVSPV